MIGFSTLATNPVGRAVMALSLVRYTPSPRTDQTQSQGVYLTKLNAITARPTGFVASVEKPINDDVLVVEMTLTDPIYAGPQRRTAYYQRMADTATLEYACSAEHWLAELEKNRVSK